MTRQQRRKAERGGPNPLHPSFWNYTVTNRAMRRDPVTIRRMLKESFGTSRYDQILNEIDAT